MFTVSQISSQHTSKHKKFPYLLETVWKDDKIHWVDLALIKSMYLWKPRDYEVEASHTVYILYTFIAAEVVRAHGGLSPDISNQGKGINKLKLSLQKEMFLRYLKLAGKGPEFLLTSSQQELGRRQQIHVMEGATSASVRSSSADCTGDYRAVQDTAGPGPLNERGQHMGESSLGECDDNSSSGPNFVRGNKKITSENKYYLGYWLKKGKLMPRHHA